MPLNTDLTEFTTTSPVIATFDFKDLASGTGFIQFFLTQSTGPEYNLFDRETFSEEAKVDNNNTFTFNTSIFNLTRTIEGEALFEAAFRIVASGSNRTLTINATLKLVSGGTPTTIGTFQQMSKGSTTDKFFINSSKATISNTIVKVGDYLALEVVLTGSAGFANFFIDPSLRTSGTLGTSKLNVPFRVNV